MIAMKREVAAWIKQVFRGANVKNQQKLVRKLATSHCTEYEIVVRTAKQQALVCACKETA